MEFVSFKGGFGNYQTAEMLLAMGDSPDSAPSATSPAPAITDSPWLSFPGNGLADRNLGDAAGACAHSSRSDHDRTQILGLQRKFTSAAETGSHDLYRRARASVMTVVSGDRSFHAKSISTERLVARTSGVQSCCPCAGACH